MAGTTIIGRGGEIAISTDGGTTFNKLGGVVKISASFSIDEVDSTDMDSNGFKELILGDMGGEYSLDLNYEEDDAQQIVARNAYWNRSKWKYRVRPQTGTGKIQVTSDGWLTQWPIDIPENSKLTQQAKIKTTGTITQNAQP
jgi:predicted secreted protein